MRKIYSILYLLCFIYYSNAQNLVLNWSFEDTVTCPQTGSNINNTKFWYSPSSGTPDYYNQCSNPSAVGVPKNNVGYQNPKTGKAYSGIGVYWNTTDTREYLSDSLLNALIKGNKYCISFYISLANISKYAVDTIGCYISKDTIYKNSWSPFLYSPQIKNKSGNNLTDTLNWILISDTFTAKGGENHITIGNFNTDANTTVSIVNNSGWNGSYYYIDDVSVIKIPDSANAGSNKIICPGDSVQLGAAAQPRVLYQWQPAAGLNNATIAQPYARPTLTTTYTLTIQSDTIIPCFNGSSSTVTVTIQNCDTASPPNATSSLKIPNIFTPNGDGVNETFELRSSNIRTLNLKIYNRWGVKVYEQDCNLPAFPSLPSAKNCEISWDGHTSAGVACQAGTYYYIVTGKGTDEKEYAERGFLTLLR